VRPTTAGGDRPEFQFRNQQEIDDVHRVVVPYGHGSPIRERVDEFPRRHWNISAVGEMEDEGLKRLGFVSDPELFERHGGCLGLLVVD
jgi:hypothetical protein